MAEDNKRPAAGGQDQGGSDQPPARGEVENPESGLTPSEERAFAEMERDGSSSADVESSDHGSRAGAQTDQGAGGQQPGQQAPGAQQQQPQPGADGEDDGEDDEDGEGEAGGQQAGAEGQQPGQPGQQPKKKARVSRTKYDAVERRANEAERKLREREEMLARADERMAIINQALQSPQPLPGAQPGQAGAGGQEDDPQPDREKEPFEWMAWNDRRVERLEKAVQGMAEGRVTETKVRNLESAYMSDAQAFNQREPNFLPGYAHLMGVRTAQLALWAFGKNVSDPNVKLTPQEQNYIQAQIAGEERSYIAKAVERGQSPAEYLYLLARSSGFVPMEQDKLLAWYGYAAQPGDQGGQQQQQPGGDQQQPGGQQQAPAQQQQKPNGQQAKPNGNGGQPPQQQRQPTVADEIARIRNGQDASMSLGNAGGTPQASLSAEQLANMPQAEFDALMNRLSPREQDALLGA